MSYYDRKYSQWLGVMALLSVAALGVALLRPPLWVALVVVVFVVWGTNRIAWILDLWNLGESAEKKVRQKLDELKGYSYYPKLQIVQHGDMDDVVVGPTGVFAIEVKNWKGKIGYQNKKLTVNGYPRDGGWNQAYASKKTIEDVLSKEGISIRVHPIVCFAGRQVKLSFGTKPVDGVQIIGLKWLKDVIRKTNDSLSGEQIAAVMKILDRYKK